MPDDLLLEVLKLRKEVAELRSIVTEKERLKSAITTGGLEGKITSFLHELKVSPKLKGFSMIREAILEVCENPDLAVTKELYPNIANKFQTTPKRVERAIRTAIETSWAKNKRHPFYSSYFTERPTNSDLIYLVADQFTQNEKTFMEVQ